MRMDRRTTDPDPDLAFLLLDLKDLKIVAKNTLQKFILIFLFWRSFSFADSESYVNLRIQMQIDTHRFSGSGTALQA